MKSFLRGFINGVTIGTILGLVCISVVWLFVKLLDLIWLVAHRFSISGPILAMVAFVLMYGLLYGIIYMLRGKR